MAGVVFEHVYKRYTGNVVAITDMNVEIRDKAVSYTHLTLPTICSV